ncbi:MAG: hypothetical protein ACM3JQ_00085 [Candidatus Eiseniibacteriota bacterium]
MNVQEFEKRAESIVEDELKSIKNMVKKIPDSKAKEEADQLGLDTIDTDIESDPHAFQALKNYVANMILVLVKNKPEDIDYEHIINEISSHIMTFCVGYKAALIKS